LSDILVNRRGGWKRTVLVIVVLLLTGCQSEDLNVYGAGIRIPVSTPTSTMRAIPTEEPPVVFPKEDSSVRPSATLAPADWKEFPVLPQVSSRVEDIYAQGISLGNNPQAFAKVGDCGGSISWFLGPFEDGPNHYNLGEYAYLQTVIDHFSGSFGRNSVAAQNGFTASSVFAPVWSDQSQCYPGETPLACEYRVLKPSFVFVMLGTNDRWDIGAFEGNMREIIEYSIDHGVVPILGTKADNFEGDESINGIIARLAIEYEVPLWNFWRAVQPLPRHGLEKDEVHLTWGPVDFDDPENLQMAWPVRNLTALQTLDRVWRTVAEID
jgi:hypothetical protein